MEKDKKKKPNKVEKEFVKNTIELNPTIKEQSEKTVVIAWGRMNPVTSGHEKLVNKVKNVARQNKADVKIFLSHSQDPKKNPLSYNDKIELARQAFGNIVYKSVAKTIIDVMKQLQSSYQKVILVAGSDRVPDFQKLLSKYNGRDYNFDSIEVVSAGERDPDADDVSGMSASKLRALAVTGDKEAFKKGLPSKLKTKSDGVYALVRSGMNLSEGIELEEALNIRQRLQRARVMRRLAPRLKMKRAKAAKRMASADKLKVRARKKAIQFLRKKVAGKKGANYGSLTTAQKIQIDKLVDKRKNSIERIAKRILPKVRRDEMIRFKQATTSGPVMKKNVNEAFEDQFEGKAYYSGLSKSTAAKRKAHFNKYKEYDDDNPAAYKKAPGDATAKTKPSVHTKRYHQMFSDEAQMKFDRRFSINRRIAEELNNDKGLLDLVDEIFESYELQEAKAMEGLKKKAEKSGMPYGILKKVYDRGVAAWRTGHRPGTTPQQWGYARVNSFVTKSSGTWGKADSDLAAKVRNESVDEAFDSFLNEGVNDPSIFKAVFLAGGPGSGKSFIVGKTALTALGFKVVNSDAAFETGLRNAGMEMSPENIYSPKGQEIRGRAKAITKSMMQNYINGRLGLVIDGTGKDYAKIEKQAKMLRELGYEVAMIFVNTDIDTALERNRMRSRSLPDEQVEVMWNEVQRNLGKFQNFFRQKMFIVDNSTGANYKGAVLSTYKRISAWSKKAPTAPAAKKWINTARGVSEEHGAGEEGTNKLKNRYKKDTPGQNVNEAFESLLEQDTCDLVSIQQMKAFEKFVDRMFEKYNIDFQFTKHFGDRMSDDRNNPCIKMKELADFISKIYKRQGKSLKSEAGAEAVIKDMQSDLNIPVVVKYDQKNDEFDIVMKTIMRKKNFSTPNKIIKY